MAKINIEGLDKARVLHALWHASHAQGLSFLALPQGGDFTLGMAETEVKNNPHLYFDYISGHVIKCDLSGDEFDDWLFDRDCGEGAAARAIQALRDSMNTEEDV